MYGVIKNARVCPSKSIVGAEGGDRSRWLFCRYVLHQVQFCFLLEEHLQRASMCVAFVRVCMRTLQEGS
jgi:hypothetical protein